MNRFKVGDMVKVVKKSMVRTSRFDNSWVKAMDAAVNDGRTYKVIGITARGILINSRDGGAKADYRFPPACLQKVKKSFVVGDMVKVVKKTGDRWVEPMRKYLGGTFQVSGVSDSDGAVRFNEIAWWFNVECLKHAAPIPDVCGGVARVVKKPFSDVSGSTCSEIREYRVVSQDEICLDGQTYKCDHTFSIRDLGNGFVITSTKTSKGNHEAHYYSKGVEGAFIIDLGRYGFKKVDVVELKFYKVIINDNVSLEEFYPADQTHIRVPADAFAVLRARLVNGAVQAVDLQRK